MEFLELGKTGEKIPVIGMGTWKLSKDGISALKTGISLGSNFIDTAEMYQTEKFVAEILKENRDEVFIATKVSPHHLRYDDVIKACNNSLNALGIKTIDLYQIHWPNPSIPISETIKAMEKLVSEGKIRYIGVSNFSIKELKEAQEAMRSGEIVSNQIEYSVTERDPESSGMSAYCLSEKITIIAYSPLGSGSVLSISNKKIYGKLNEIGSKYGKSAAQVALNWLISKRNITAIPKANTPDHMAENIAASGWKLKPEDISEINSFL
jgi:hypothetical protein